MRNSPRPVKWPRLGSFASDRLFDKDSELSEGLEHTELTLPLLEADCCDKMIVTNTFYGNNQCNEEKHNGFWNQVLNTAPTRWDEWRCLRSYLPW
jgi:hypothetical protein